MNAFNQDLTDTVVVLQREVFRTAYRTLPYRLFHIKDGSGAKPETWGRKIFGHYLFVPGQDRLKAGEGGQDWTYGFNVERLATKADLLALAHVQQAAAGHLEAEDAP
jgi:hypothetical protein